MSQEDWFQILRTGRKQGADALWIGGGEPSLRPDLLRMLRVARKLGYRRIKLQTNATLLSSSENLDRLAAAGLNEVNLSIKGHTAALHDRFTQTPGSFELLSKAVDALAKTNIVVEADLLLYRDNVSDLEEMVGFYLDRGIRRFNLWHLSLFGASEEQRAALSIHVPEMSEVGVKVASILSAPGSERIDVFRALHLPPCVLPSEHWSHLFRARDLALRVFDPGGSVFMLEESPFEGGVYLERCGTCAARPICDGLRQDYLDVHSDKEFQPTTADVDVKTVTMQPF